MAAPIAIDISLIGDKKLIRAFKELEQKVQKKIVKTATKDIAERILRNAKSRVPVNSGKLKDKLKIKAFSTKKGIGHRVITPTRNELGISSDPKKGYYPAHIELGFINARTGRHVAPNPYLRPALENHKDSLRARLSLKIKRGILDAAMSAGRKR